ncbi:aldehyde dehydrogenase family protein [Mycobacterium sp. M26]|uniref:aldehyde dehydrogenase family protein n=1 Tax=Mycobacterium sp. M26 TaxID=1762962 RepID=UPI00073E4C0A|nr:aldehyde dehydrogenase family protein [Mycobacterium sp. M26]
MASSSPEGRLFIDGEFREAKSGSRYEVINPADDSIVGTAADAAPEDVYDAITAARRAFDDTSWGTDHKFRRHCLEQLQAALREERESFHALITAEAGVCASVHPTHVDLMIEGMDYWNELTTSFDWERDLGPYTILGMPSDRRVRYEPYGVVGAITPWNAPFMTAIWKVSHALATGNTVVLKSAPDTPFTGARMAQIAAEKTDIPPGVFNAISSEDKAIAGDAMTGDPRVDLFHFTGSPGVGQRIMERAATGIRKVVLELGGKSGNLLLPDADLDLACGLGTMMCMSSSGQGCALATRMIVHADIYDDVVARLEALIGGLPWGDPSDPVNLVGPIIRKEQVDRMAGLVERAIDAGARLVVGGKRADRDRKGNWYEPTLLADVDENAEIAQTEVFGPVLSVVRYDGDDDEAVRVANNSRYGLAAYVQSSDQERALRVANKLRAGTVNIGPAFYLSPDGPFGGWGISGVGVEHGIDGFREYLRIKTIATPHT